MLVALLAGGGCERPKPVSLEQEYRSIEQEFIAGDLARADAHVQPASAQAQRSSTLWATRFRLQQAKIELYQGRYQAALLLLQSPVPPELHDISLEITRGTLRSIAQRRVGDAAGARDSLAAAEALCSDDRACVEVRLAQGSVAVEGASLDEADRRFLLALSSARASGQRFFEMQALLNLGVVALRHEHYDAALDRFAAATRLATELGAHLTLEKTAGSEASALFKLGDYRRALAAAQRAETQAAALGVPVDRVRWLNDVGQNQDRLGDLSAAQASYEHSLQLARELRNAELTGDALVALASVSLRRGDLDDAQRRAQEAEQIAAARGNAADSLRPALIEAKVLAARGESAAAKQALLQLEQRCSTKLSVRWEVENTLALLAVKTNELTAADQWFRRAIDTFRGQRFSVSGVSSRLPFMENGAPLYLSYVDFLTMHGQTEEALRALDGERAETLAEGLRFDDPSKQLAEKMGSLSPEMLARRLHATILVYCLRSGGSYLWAISPRRTAFLRLPGQETILPLIERYTHAIRSAKDVTTPGESAGYTLFHLLVEPAAELLTPGGKIFVLGDRGMDGLNFETLLTSSEQPHFWIEQAEVVDARSLSLLATLRKPSRLEQAQRKLLLIGDPAYAQPEFGSLPQARDEVQSVQGHFAPERRLVLTGAAATPAAYRQSEPGRFSHVHFVAHATASTLTPLESAVILSQPPQEEGAYRLYARDILQRPLHADLVTISSCYGSGVQAYSGEGLVGLTWAFLRAGAHHVVAALWEVSDASTPRLMNDFYDGLERGAEPAEALRAAKLKMIHAGGVFSKPFYWAAFQLYVGG